MAALDRLGLRQVRMALPGERRPYRWYESIPRSSVSPYESQVGSHPFSVVSGHHASFAYLVGGLGHLAPLSPLVAGSATPGMRWP